MIKRRNVNLKKIIAGIVAPKQRARATNICGWSYGGSTKGSVVWGDGYLPYPGFTYHSDDLHAVFFFYLPLSHFICHIFVISAIFQNSTMTFPEWGHKKKSRWNNLKLHVMGFRLINKHMIRGVKIKKKNGMIPSLIFGSIILLSILVLTLFIFNEESILKGITDGFTDGGPISVQD